MPDKDCTIETLDELAAAAAVEDPENGARRFWTDTVVNYARRAVGGDLDRLKSLREVLDRYDANEQEWLRSGWRW